ncbi:arsenate reductase family protein [Calditerricola satsumensis]|uniref:Arsenate reductase n=1 Tax=Calditerricola satsumensis TaxID=373054 RepID=A0A8J3B947_9BACI|nr:arsenate reductase family protein [Calditerricola satsumensis]GGK04441.1 arsenate reductase [Calditerricola satsumensis]
MPITFYGYPQCGTCRKAKQWLDARGIAYEAVNLVTDPPDKETLRALIEKSGLPVRKFFNTSGQRYRELGLKEKLPSMTDEEMLELLASDGKLIKRPIVTDGERVTVGFDEATFARVWGTGA